MLGQYARSIVPYVRTPVTVVENEELYEAGAASL